MKANLTGLLVGVTAILFGIIVFIGSQPPMMPFSCYALKSSCPLPVVTGNVMPGWEPVVEAWKKYFEEGYELGAHISVFWKNKHVVDVALGYSDKTFSTQFANETLQMIFSSSKVVESLVIAMLVDRGHVKYTDKIASFWPEFAVNGKQDVTVGDLMAHAGGVHTLGRKLNLETVMDHEKLSTVLAETKLDERSFRQKGKQAYHAISRGLFASQICRRVDPKHRSLKQFAEEEIFTPLNIPFKYGANGSEVGGMHGMSKMKVYTGLVPRLVLPDWLTDLVYRDHFLDLVEKQVFKSVRVEGSVAKGSLGIFAAEFPEFADWIRVPGWSAIDSPSTHGFTNAYALSRIANTLVNEGTDPFTGVQLITPQGLKVAEAPSLGFHFDEMMLSNVSYTEGGWSDKLDTRLDMESGEKCVGWGGAGGSLFQWCRSVDLAFAYTPNYYSPHLLDWRGATYLRTAHAIATKLKKN